MVTFTCNITTGDTSEDNSLDQCQYIIWATGPVTNYTTKSIQKHYIRGFEYKNMFPNITLCLGNEIETDYTYNIYINTLDVLYTDSLM